MWATPSTWQRGGRRRRALLDAAHPRGHRAPKEAPRAPSQPAEPPATCQRGAAGEKKPTRRPPRRWHTDTQGPTNTPTPHCPLPQPTLPPCVEPCACARQGRRGTYPHPWADRSWRKTQPWSQKESRSARRPRTPPPRQTHLRRRRLPRGIWTKSPRRNPHGIPPLQCRPEAPRLRRAPPPTRPPPRGTGPRRTRSPRPPQRYSARRRDLGRGSRPGPESPLPLPRRWAPPPSP